MKKINLFILLCLVFYMCEGVFMAYMGNYHTDENWWFYGTTMVAQGYHPHFDFVSHHNPLFYYIYAVPQYLFGNSMLIARLTSVFFGLSAFYLAMRMSLKFGGRMALLICSAMFIINLYVAYRYSIVHYQALQTLILTFIVYVCLMMRSIRLKAIIIGSLCALLIATRYFTDYVVLFILVYFVHLFYVDLKRGCLTLCFFIVTFAAVFLPFFVYAYDKFYFNTVWYMLNMEHFKTAFGVGDHSIIDIIVMRLDWIKEAAVVFAPVFVVLVYLGCIKMYEYYRLNKTDNKYRLPIDKRYALIALFIIISTVFYIVPHSSDLPHQLCFVFPLMAFISAVGYSRVIAERVLPNRLHSYALISVLIVLGVMLQIPLGKQQNFAYAFSRSDLKNIYDVANKIQQYIPKGGEVFTFTPLYAAQAERHVLRGMEMEYATFFPTWDTDSVKEKGLLNVDLIKEYIKDGRPSILILTEKRFFSDEGYGEILKPYRADIIKLIDEKYKLAELIDMPGSIMRGDIHIFIPRNTVEKE